jgi:glucose uptake protein GlcU
MELFSPQGVKIGNTQKATVDVHAEWESLGALIIGILAVLLFGFGIFLSIRRRRRERAADDSVTVEVTEPVEVTDDDASTTPGTDKHG